MEDLERHGEEKARALRNRGGRAGDPGQRREPDRAHPAGRADRGGQSTFDEQATAQIGDEQTGGVGRVGAPRW